MNKILLSLCIATLLFAISCGTDSNKPANSSNAKNAEVKKGVAPVADAEAVLIEMEKSAYGTIKLELYSNIAPQMVARFKELAKEGYYNGIAFHRVNQSVIQAGDANSKSTGGPKPAGEAGSGKPNVPAEFSDILYDTGILGAARLGNDVNSANSQFFITLKREAAFDNKYTIFGKVVEGMNNVSIIAGVPKDGEKPQEPVRIKAMTVVQR